IVSALLHIAEPMRPIFDRMGFSPEMVFTDPAIKPWRVLADRENCIWDIAIPDGPPLRLHVKRYPSRRDDPAAVEAAAIQCLEYGSIPTVELAAWGRLDD